MKRQINGKLLLLIFNFTIYGLHCKIDRIEHKKHDALKKVKKMN